MRTLMIVASIATILGLLAGSILFQNMIAPQSQGPTPTLGKAISPAETPTPLPEFRPPAEIPLGPISDNELRTQLIAQRQGLCEELEFIAGIIISTGILRQVPSTISEMAGMPIDELEAKETRACQTVEGELPDEQKTTSELLNEARSTEWLVRMHLAAMDRVLMENPTFRPIDAEGSFRAFFEMHNINVQVMRERYRDLSDTPTLEEAGALASFWQDVLLPHAKAEDETLWPLARSVGGEEIARAADLLEAEHRTIDEGVARYMETLQAVERGQAQLGDLVSIGRDVRIRTELHFGKEEESVVRPLQEMITSEQFRPVVEEIDRAFGPWLREHGWQWPQ
ncbi:MAG: hemerythrin domain-containing protein [Chloroflexi bacterium]|nr:hemerythrin domain-containing protein [Chloroflexota bacterium]